jgi:uncharacterized protein YcaQ
VSVGNTQSISRAEARRIALAAQRIDRARPTAPVTDAEIIGLIGHLGLLQLDSVSVFCRSHYMPIFSRLGSYDRSRLDAMAAHSEPSGPRELIEYWGHEASLIPLELYPLLRWRMARADREAWSPLIKLAAEQPELIASTLELVAERGPMRAKATGGSRPASRPGVMWNWHDGKIALEYLFYSGRVAAAQRINFERLYDLPERVLPDRVLAAPAWAEADAQCQLLRVAAAALGVATEPDLGDYFRLTRADSKARVGELVQAGELIPVDVEGWARPAYLWPRAAQPAAVHARALLSPFDSLIWFRERTMRLFDFKYRIEIYTPAAKRQYGYYVLPFLLGDALVGRVDLKSDRRERVLMVQAAFAEPGVDRKLVAAELAAELRAVAAWLDLDQVRTTTAGDLAPELSKSLRRRSRRRSGSSPDGSGRDK